MQRFVTAVCAMLFVAQSAQAHDFWLQPARFQTAPQVPVTIDFMIGHSDEVERWHLTWERLHSFKSFGPDGVRDHQSAVVPSGSKNSGGASIALQREGTHVLAMESYHSLSDLPAEKFNAYAQKEGLTAVLLQRESTGAANTNGREMYSRRAKALMQIGDMPSDHVLQPIGQTLEIVPERNPYARTDETSFPVRVLFQGRPLVGALVDLTALGAGTEPTQGQRTDAQGRAVFEVPRDGAWKINAIWSRAVKGRPEADFDTVFASLTFAVPAAATEQKDERPGSAPSNG